MPATYCDEAQLPPTDELDGATELAEWELGILEGAVLDFTELGGAILEGAEDERTDDGALELAPSHVPSSAHSCHWPE